MSNWSKLYTLAGSISALQPWRFMYEDEIFGVRNPESGIISFISVMGHLGEHYSITAYLGERGLQQFHELSENADHNTPEMVLEISQLMLSFLGKEFLQKEDRAVMKETGVSYSGKELYSVFRSHKPGMMPWFLDEEEQEEMIIYLEQFLEVVAMSKVDKPWLKFKNSYLVREPVKSDKGMKWKDTYQKIERRSISVPSYEIDSALIEKIRKIPLGHNIYEIDFFLTMAKVKEKDNRPYFTYLLLVVDQRNELIVFSQVMNPSDGIDNMLISIPELLLKSFVNKTALPQFVFTSSPRLFELLSPLMKELGIRHFSQKRLKSLDKAKKGIVKYFG